MKSPQHERSHNIMVNIDTKVSEVEGYMRVGPLPLNVTQSDGQYIGQFPTSTPGSSKKVGRQTDSMVLAKPDSERWWSTKPYVPPLH
jgi:hypothetical protein